MMLFSQSIWMSAGIRSSKNTFSGSMIFPSRTHKSSLYILWFLRIQQFLNCRRRPCEGSAAGMAMMDSWSMCLYHWHSEYGFRNGSFNVVVNSAVVQWQTFYTFSHLLLKKKKNSVESAWTLKFFVVFQAVEKMCVNCCLSVFAGAVLWTWDHYMHWVKWRKNKREAA